MKSSLFRRFLLYNVLILLVPIWVGSFIHVKTVKVVAAMIEGAITSMCTASALQMHNDTQVFLDEEAAGALKLADYYRWIQKHKPNAP